MENELYNTTSLADKRYTVSVTGSIICVNGVYVANSFARFRAWFLESGLDVRSFDNWPFELGIGENLLTVYERYAKGLDWYPVWSKESRQFLVTVFEAYRIGCDDDKAKLTRMLPKYFAR